MPKLSAGILLYRLKDGGVELLLVHPGGPFWAKKDAGAWSVPKGEYLDGEDVLEAAKREFKEELGSDVPSGTAIALDTVKYNNKLLTVWAVAGDFAVKSLNSNTFELEWPPRSGKMEQYPEVDRARWFDPLTAEEKLVKGQRVLVARLLDALKLSRPEAHPQEEPSQLSLF